MTLQHRVNKERIIEVTADEWAKMVQFGMNTKWKIVSNLNEKKDSTAAETVEEFIYKKKQNKRK